MSGTNTSAAASSPPAGEAVAAGVRLVERLSLRQL